MIARLPIATLTATLFLCDGPAARPSPAPPRAPADAASAPADPLRLASLVSRDAQTFVWVADRAAFLRRMRATPFWAALADLGDDDAIDDLESLATELSLVFPPGVFSRWAATLAHGSGDMALAVDGFTIASGKSEPNILLLADARGMEKLVPALVLLAQDPDEGEDALDDLELPFEIDEDARATVTTFRGVQIVQATIEDFAPVAFATANGIIFASRDQRLVERAIDRAFDATVGSLRDSARFRVVWDELKPTPGSLVWYSNLRKLRQSDMARAAAPGSLRAEFADVMRPFDGAGFTVRGRGESVDLRVFLERGAGRQQDPNPLFRSNERFRSLALFPAESTCEFSARVTGEQAADAIGAVAEFMGGRGVEAQLDLITRSLASSGPMPSLLEHLDGEMTVAQTKAASPGESVPRVAFAVECLDAAAVDAWFQEAVRRAGPVPVRPTRVAGANGYEILFPNPEIPLRPVFVVKDGFLLGASQGFVMRDLLKSIGTPAASLAERHDLLAAFDRVDHDVREPATALAWLDGARFTSSALTWASCAIRGAPSRAGREALERAQAILETLMDPDVEETLKGVAVRAELRDDGVLIEAAGP